jgi:hypothetical protein
MSEFVSGRPIVLITSSALLPTTADLNSARVITLVAFGAFSAVPLEFGSHADSAIDAKQIAGMNMYLEMLKITISLQLWEKLKLQ